MNKNYIIRQETEKDYKAVENLTREAFWNVYKEGCDEHYMVHVMRGHEDFIPELALVIEQDGEIIGNVMYTKAMLKDKDGNEKPILSFGPISIHPEYQRMGYSRILLEHSFEIAKNLGYDVIAIFGDPANYVVRGFRSSHRYHVCMEGDVYPAALLVKQLKENALDGRTWYYYESSAFEAMTQEGLEQFEAQFPPKKKEWKPSQEIFYIQSHSTVR